MPLPLVKAQDLRRSHPIECYDTTAVLADAKILYEKFLAECADLKAEGTWKEMGREEKRTLAAWNSHMRTQIWQLESAVTNLSN